MAELDLALKITGDTKNLKVQVVELNKALGNTGKSGKTASAGLTKTAKSADHLDREARQAAKSANTLAGSLGGLAAKAAALVGFGMLARDFASTVVEADRLRGALTTAVGGIPELADAAFKSLEKFATETPYAMEQSVDAFIKLQNLGIAPTEERMMSFANTSSAMGKDLNQMIEAVADASVGEMERLKEFGVRASKQGDEISFTFQGVTQTVRNDSAAIIGYLEGIGNVNFAGAVEDQMKRLPGVLSNFQDQVSGLWRDIGDAGATSWMGQILGVFTSGMKGLRWLVKDGFNIMATEIIASGDRLLINLSSDWDEIKLAASQAFDSMAYGSETAWEVMKLGAAKAVDYIIEVFAGMIDKLSGIGSVIDWLPGISGSEAKIKSAASSLRGYASNVATVEASIKKLETARKSELIVAAESMKALKRERVEKLAVSDASLELAHRNNELEGSETTLNDVVKQTTKSVEESAKAIKATTEEVDDFADVLDLLNPGARKLEDQMWRVEEAFQAGAITAEQYGAALDALSGKAEGAKKEIDKVAEGIDVAGGIGDSLADAIMGGLSNGFDNGRDFAKSFLDDMKKWFANTVLRPQVQALMSGLVSTGANALGFSSGGGGGGGGTGSISSLFQDGGGVSSGLMMAGAGLAGNLIGSKFGGKHGGTASSYGAMIGMAAAGPIGAAIGIALGTIGSKIFGGADRKTTFASQATSGSLDGNLKRSAIDAISTSQLGEIGVGVGDIGKDRMPREKAEELVAGFQQITDAVALLDDGIVEHFGLIGDDLEATKQAAEQSLKWGTLKDPGEAINKFVRDRYDRIFSTINDEIATGLYASISASTEDATSGVAALLGMFGAMDQWQGLDAQGAADEALALSRETLTDAANRQADALGELIAGFDGSYQSTLSLTAGIQERMQYEIALRAEIAKTTESITASIGDWRESLILEGLDTEGQYDRMQDQVSALYDEVGGAGSASELQTIYSDIEQLSKAAYSLLQPEVQDAKRPELLEFLGNVESSITGRMAELEGDITTETEKLQTDSSAKMSGVATEMNAAAKAIKVAAADSAAEIESAAAALTAAAAATSAAYNNIRRFNQASADYS